MGFPMPNTVHRQCRWWHDSRKDSATSGTMLKLGKIVPPVARFTHKTCTKEADFLVNIVPLVAHRTRTYKSSDPHGLKAVRGRGHERLTHLKNEPAKTPLVVMPSDRALRARPMATDKGAKSGR